MPKDHCARAVPPCRGRFQRSAAWGNSCRGHSSTRHRVACDHAETPNSLRIHCRGTHRQEWLTPIRLAGRPPSQTCGTSGMEPAVLHAPGLPAGAGSSASGLREPRCETRTKPGRWDSRRPHRLHQPAIFRGSCRMFMSCTQGNQTPAEPVRSGSWAKPLLNFPTRRSTTISQTGRGRNTRIASIAVDRTSGPLMPVQCGGNQPTPLQKT